LRSGSGLVNIANSFADFQPQALVTMVRLLHTSDWHLGRFLYGKSLLEDQAAILQRLLELIDRVKPHALLIAGDVFDRALPPEAAITLFDLFLRQVAGERKLPVVMIPGNHDSCERLGFASKLLRDRGVTIFSRVEDSLEPVIIKGDGGAEALIYGIPFVEPLLISRLLGREDLDTPDLSVGVLCRTIIERKPKDASAVLLCHAFVAGGESSDSEKEIFIGGSSSVDRRAFEGFAYTALGHLHKPQRVGSEYVRYSGSLLPYSKSEVGHDKSITEIRIHSNAKPELEYHCLPQLRKLRYIEGDLENLIRLAVDDESREDYLIAGLTDRGAVLDAFAKLHLYYPNLLHVSRSGGYSPDIAPALARARERENLSELDLFSEFFQSASGAELSAPEREELIATLAEIEREERTR
jgi:exonuclease SbcD